MQGRINFHPAIPLFERPGLTVVLTPLAIAGLDVFVHPVEGDDGWRVRVSGSDFTGSFRMGEDASKTEWESAVATHLRDRPRERGAQET